MNHMWVYNVAFQWLITVVFAEWSEMAKFIVYVKKCLYGLNCSPIILNGLIDFLFFERLYFKSHYNH